MPIKKKRTMQREFKNLNAVELMNFVSDKYHTSEKRNLSSLNQCFLLMPATDTKNHPELTIIRNYFNDIRKLLEKYLTNSETVYFPAIRKWTGGVYDIISLKNRVHSTHEEISKLFSTIRTLTSNYTPPPDASGWMKLCYALLHDLESDTSNHLFVEESILPLKLGA
jgi:regulator of cell morphogenesis and NO signaling